MKKNMLFFALALLITSCQESQQDLLLQRVIESSEFKALADARFTSRENKMTDLLNEREAFKSELVGLTTEEKKARWEERRQNRDEEREERMKEAEKLRLRNERIMAIADQDPNMNKEKFEAITQKIDQEMGITTGNAVRTYKTAAMDALLNKFPEINQIDSPSDFLKLCFETYQIKNS